VAEAHAAIRRFEFPVVLKADGLAAGKGVVIANTREEAKRTAEAMLAGELVGNAGRRLLVEEFLKGEEVSFIAITDGRTVIPLEATQDHKAIFDGDRGPNTGGMGAYCDGRILPPSATEDVLSTVVLPVVEYMRDKEEPFTGFLYAGLMLTEDGPKVLEFNVRLGDPETQALMMRLNSDLASLLLTCARGALSGIRPGWSTDPSVCVVMAAAGYPGQVRTGDPITGIAEAERDGAVVFHAGTACVNGEVRTAGGRVLGVTASGADLPAAIARTYDAVGRIRFEGAHYRTDIGVKGLKRW
ncbi:MAG: phosphoribosylamine--glycine ligase, partial [Bryobacteraceae bacterium]|nr:phosphoribosylamine--glycine ligase [Bryobacteraceae bacterium]